MILLVAAAAAFVAYVLWPTWPSQPVAIDAPAIPVTIAGVLFDVPRPRSAKRCNGIPASTSASTCTSSGRRSTPPQPDSKAADKEPIDVDNAAAAATCERSEATLRHHRRIGSGAAAARAAAHDLSALYRSPGRRRPRRIGHICRSVPARPMTGKTWFMSAANPSNSSPFARATAARCPAPASRTGARSGRDHAALSARLAVDWRTWPRASTGFSPNCTRSEIDGSVAAAGRQSLDQIPFTPNPYPELAFQEYRPRAAFHRRRIRRR